MSDYDKNTDYTALIRQAAAIGDYTGAADYEKKRNAKILGEGLSYAATNEYADYLPGGSKYEAGLLGGISGSGAAGLAGAYTSVITQPASVTDLSDTINRMYDGSLAASKARIDAQYAGYDKTLDAEKSANDALAYENRNSAAAESARDREAFQEVQNANGLSSGTRGQAALAYNVQLQSSLNAIRSAQQTADAEIERQRSAYSEQYAAAIRQAAADNDSARAKALYEEAVRLDEALTAQKQRNTEYAAGYLSDLMSGSGSSSSGGSSSRSSGSSKSSSGKSSTSAGKTPEKKALGILGALYQKGGDEAVAADMAYYEKAGYDTDWLREYLQTYYPYKKPPKNGSSGGGFSHGTAAAYTGT